MCCTWLSGNTGRKKSQSALIVHLCRAVSLQLRHVSAIGKKLVKQQYVLHMCPQCGELTSGWDWFRSFWHACKFQRVSSFAFVTAATSLTGGKPNCTMFSHVLGWYAMYTFLGALAAWQNFARCKIHFTSKSCICLYWQHYCKNRPRNDL